MDWSIGRRIAAGYVFALFALIAIGLVSYRNFEQSQEDAAWVAHTLDVLRGTATISANLYAAQLHARNYQLLSDVEDRTAFDGAVERILGALQNVKKLTVDNPLQQQRLTQLESLVRQRLATATVKLDADLENAARQIVRDSNEELVTVSTLLGDVEKEERGLLAKRQEQQRHGVQQSLTILVTSGVAAMFLVGFAGLRITRSIVLRLRALEEGARKIGAGEYSYRVNLNAHDELGVLATHFNGMAAQVAHREAEQAAVHWQKSNLASLAQALQRQRDVAAICQSVLSRLASLLDAQGAAFYVVDAESACLRLRASYANDGAPAMVAFGQGLIGQCYAERKAILLKDVPPDYFISSALGSAKPRVILIFPALFEDSVVGVVELASLTPFNDVQRHFVLELADMLGSVLHTVQLNLRTEQLLAQAQSLSNNLQRQQTQLSEANRELEQQQERLLKSERQLIEQQEELKQSNQELEQANEELQQANAEMEQQTALLSEQKRKLLLTNSEVEQARGALEDKARELALTSQYKSEFLASMSHELRTPLNSLLILSTLLAENPEQNLTPKQLQYVRTIEASGNDLLELINDILDLSKVESGAVEIEIEDYRLSELEKFADQSFRHVAEQKGLQFKLEAESNLPLSIATNTRRLQQVLKNLLSNAVKFTERGTIALRIHIAAPDWDRGHSLLDNAKTVIAFEVSDTGIGIAPDKLQLIFEAFQQADAGTARKYGGTGLGLSISREIARLLGGALQVKSDVEKGSTFTLYLPTQLPEDYVQRLNDRAHARVGHRPVSSPVWLNALVPTGETEDTAVSDDRSDLQPGDRVLLIVEDDRHFSSVLVDYARSRNFKTWVARTAAEGLTVARRMAPAAITLDLVLPDYDGWVLLDRLKHDSNTRHLPVHIISVSDERQRSLSLGALSHLQKPVTRDALDQALNQTLEFLERPVKTLLLVEDDPIQLQSLIEFIAHEDLRIVSAATAAEALSAAASQVIDCVVVDLGLPDATGAELIKQLHGLLGAQTPPIIVYTGKSLSRREETELRMLSDSIIVKGVKSPERLLDETALFLHRRPAQLHANQRRALDLAQKIDPFLAERKALVVDDDVRNIFAITVGLESCGMKVVYAESGQAALDLLVTQSDIDVVLLDIMMPEMDGFETMRRMRDIEHGRHLPVICVTAKAMKGDREKCLHAGASDYVTKPVDVEQLRSVLRVCLYRS